MDWWLLWACASLTVLGFITCCCTAVTCQFASDTFNRADNTDINTGSTVGWTETAGSWAIASNMLTTSSANAKATATTAHPDATPYMSVTTAVQVTSQGDTARVGIGDYYCEWKLGLNSDSYLKIFNGSGAVVAESTWLSTHAINTSYTITFCVSGTRAVVATSTSSRVAYEGAAVTGSTFWLGTGTVAGTVKFDSVTANRVETGCSSCLPHCSTLCLAGDGPEYYQAVLTGIANDVDCASCNSYNGTYIVEQGAVFSNGCAWTHTMASAPCSRSGQPVKQIAVQHSFGTSPNRVISNVEIGSFVSGGSSVLALEWRKTTSGVLAIDCELVSESIPVQSGSGFCNLSASTCTVTAL